ncbi:MAG: purine/pyrimidine permease [Alistipes sp.]|nr:purine/pyrimidine permease [Alistipes sp.]
MKLRVGVDERPSAGAMLLYGLQWLMICIPVVLTSTFVAPAGETVFFTQKLFAVMGVTMIVQALWGHRLPLVAGPAAVLLMGVLAAAGQGSDSNTIYPSMIIGGGVIALLAACGALRYVQRIFTPRIVVSILVLISFTMAKPIVGMIFSDAEHLGTALLFALVCVIAMATANNLLRGVWKTMVVIIAMLLGSLIYYALTGFPSQFVEDSQPAQLLLDGFNIDAGVVVAFLFCYIALLINEVGSVQSLGEFIEATGMERRQKRGMILTGVMNIVSGACGIVGPVDYSLSPGVVASTSCGSRYTVIPAAAAMIVIACVPELVSVLLTIPQPVMGIVLMYLMATQIAAGFHLMHESGASASFKDGLVLAIPIMVTIILSFAPQEALAAIPSLVRPIAGNGFVMGIIVVLLLEHLFLHSRRKQK